MLTLKTPHRPYWILICIHFFRNRNYASEANNDHRDITFPHAESPTENDDDDNDVNGESVDDESDDASQNKLTHTKKSKPEFNFDLFKADYYLVSSALIIL